MDVPISGINAVVPCARRRVASESDRLIVLEKSVTSVANSPQATESWSSWVCQGLG
jgi:hypothetical protein